MFINIMYKFVEIGFRLREFAVKKYGSVSELERFLGLNKNYLSQYVIGRIRPGSALQSKLRIAHCDIEWLMTGRVAADDVVFLFKIPVYDYPEKRPTKNIVAEPIVEYITAQDTGDNSKYGIVMRGKGMQPEINDGEIVIASKLVPSQNGNLAIVNLNNDEIIIARVFIQQKNVTCVYSNTTIPPRTIEKSEIKSIHRIMEKITRY